MQWALAYIYKWLREQIRSDLDRAISEISNTLLPLSKNLILPNLCLLISDRILNCTVFTAFIKLCHRLMTIKMAQTHLESWVTMQSISPYETYIIVSSSLRGSNQWEQAYLLSNTSIFRCVGLLSYIQQSQDIMRFW